MIFDFGDFFLIAFIPMLKIRTKAKTISDPISPAIEVFDPPSGRVLPPFPMLFGAVLMSSLLKV